MKQSILILTPAPRGVRRGNRVTAERWARQLRESYRVRIISEYDDEDADLLLALHATKSARGIRDFHRRHPERKIALVLTGTDLYQDLPKGLVRPRESLEIADRLIGLQELAPRALPKQHRRKTRIVLQSAVCPSPRPARRKDAWEVSVIGNLRPVKDPFRAAMASRRLPSESRIQVVHAGAAMNDAMRERAERESAGNPRYRWLGEVSRRRARNLVARSRCMVISSRSEGGANVVSEAVVCRTPVLASRVDGNEGMLGRDYEGYFPLGETAELARLMRQVEADVGFRQHLVRQCTARRSAFQPASESRALHAVIGELLGSTS